MFYRDVSGFDIPPMFEDGEMRYAADGSADTAASAICSASWRGEDGNSYRRVHFGVDGAEATGTEVPGASCTVPKCGSVEIMNPTSTRLRGSRDHQQR